MIINSDVCTLKYQTAHALEQAINSYFGLCGWIKRTVLTKQKTPVIIERWEPATMSGLAVHLGISRTTLLRYKKKKSFKKLLEIAKNKIEHSIEYGALTGKLSANVSVFVLKNNFEYTDEYKNDVTSNGHTLADLLTKNPKDLVKVDKKAKK
jgi:hypothetical protein